MQTTLDKAAPLIVSFIKANVPVNIIGSPGVGKSDAVNSVAKALNLKLIDFRLSTADPTDLSGMPFIADGRSVFLPNEAFPIATDALPMHADIYGKPIDYPVLDNKGDPVLNTDGTPKTENRYYDGWLLFLDEISNAPMSVQAAAYKLILDRQVGMHNLHPAVKIVSAGNKLDDGAAVTGEMSTALKSRMAHINIEMSINAWLDWALGANVHHSITSFINFKSTMLYQFNPKVEADTFPCPRTWGMVDKLIKAVGMNDPALQSLVAATISDGPANEFINYCKNFVGLPTYADIVKDPENTDVPKEMSAMYALSGSIGSQVKKESLTEVMKYIERMPKEFQLRTFNDFTKRDPLLVTVPAVRSWLLANAKNMVK